jgi:hypothetical protein
MWKANLEPSELDKLTAKVERLKLSWRASEQQMESRIL